MSLDVKKPAPTKPTFIILGYRISKNSPKFKVKTDSGTKKVFEFEMSKTERDILEKWRMFSHEHYYANKDYFVNKVLDKHTKIDGQTFYLISFSGYNDAFYHYWRSEAELDKCGSLIKKFEAEKQGRPDFAPLDSSFDDSDDKDYILPDSKWKEDIFVRKYETSDEESDENSDDEDSEGDSDNNQIADTEEQLSTEESDDEYDFEKDKRMLKLAADPRVHTSGRLSTETTFDRTPAPRFSNGRKDDKSAKTSTGQSFTHSEKLIGDAEALAVNSPSTSSGTSKDRPFDLISYHNIHMTPQKNSPYSEMQAQTPRRRRLQLDDMPSLSNTFSPKRACDKNHIPK
ncbi:unnamed protein product [Caenorhabditis nigoni]